MEKYTMIKSLNEIVKSFNNEGAYMLWCSIVPDEADKEDLEFIADDEELFESAIKTFKQISKHYLKDGLLINNKVY